MQSAGNFTHQTFPWVAAKSDETLHQILTIYPLEHVDGLTAEYEQHETKKDVGAAKKAVHQQCHEANDKTCRIYIWNGLQNNSRFFLFKLFHQFHFVLVDLVYPITSAK